tara:strand:- start:1473 stop:1766 length:294 start_codon:yes stop_codon:yes gene_type:complete
MKEQDYQKRISDDLTRQGYFVTNLIKTNKNGIPDLLALKFDEPPLFVECKTLKGKLSEIQKFRLNELTGRGFNCYVSYGMELKKWKINSEKDLSFGF